MRTFLLSLALAVISAAVLRGGSASYFDDAVWQLAQKPEKGYPDFGTDDLNWKVASHYIFYTLIVFPILFFVL